MGYVNSQGLTWLEWYQAAGFLMSALDKMTTGERDGLRQVWKAGVEPQAAVWTGPANYRLDPELVAAVKAGQLEYNRRHGRY